MFTLELDKGLYNLNDLKQLSLESFSPYQQRAITFCKNYSQGQENFVLKTSGSTGKPKSIQIHRHQMAASAQATIQALELSTDERFLVCISTDHIGGKMMLVRAMELGASIKVLEPKTALETESPVDFIALVPLQVYRLLESSHGRDFLESCTKVIIGGAALNQWALDQLRPFSNHIYHTFGMTETISHIALKPSDFYTIQGRLSRVDFILGIVVSGTIPVILHFVFANFVLATGNEIFYFGFKSFLHILALTLATPFYVKRFHDLNTPGYWVLIYWACLPFTIEVALLLESVLGIHINPFNEVIMLIGLIGLLVLLVLIFKKGNTNENEWGKPNKRLQRTGLTASR